MKKVEKKVSRPQSIKRGEITTIQIGNKVFQVEDLMHSNRKKITKK